MKTVRVDGCGSRNLRVDQSRLQRSAASLDSAQGNEVGNRVRTASQAIKNSTRVSQPQNRNIKQLAGTTTNKSLHNSNTEYVGDKILGVDEEVLPKSPEAHAVQSLNPSLPQIAVGAGRSPSRNRTGSRPSSVERTGSPVQEIPLEDMSDSRHNDVGIRVRNSSYSPRRFRRISTNGAVGEHQSRSPARKEVSERTTRASPLALYRDKTGERITRDPSKRVGLTSFTTNHNGNPSDAPSDSDEDVESATESSIVSDTPESLNESSSVTGELFQNDESYPAHSADCSTNATYDRERKSSSSSSFPKTLIPAEEPPASLLDNSDTTRVLAPVTSPKLIPPLQPVAMTVSEPMVIATPSRVSNGNENKISRTEVTNLLSKLAQASAQTIGNTAPKTGDGADVAEERMINR